MRDSSEVFVLVSGLRLIHFGEPAANRYANHQLARVRARDVNRNEPRHEHRCFDAKQVWNECAYGD